MKTEKIIAIFVLLGFVFKIFHVSGASVITIVSLSAMATIYFGGGFYFFCDKHIKNQNIAISIVTGVLLSIVLVGILFKLMIWPGSEFNLIIGIISLPILLIITFILKSRVKENLKMYYKNMLIRIFTWTILVYIFFFIPNEAIINHHFKNDPERARLLNLTMSNPNNLEYQNQYNAYLRQKDSLQIDKDSNY